MQYKSTRKSISDIARELKVEIVLEGAVLRSADRVRIGVQLIDPLTGTLLWAKNDEGDMRAKITLTPREKARFSTTRPVDPEAYEAFLKGRYYWYRRSLECSTVRRPLRRKGGRDPSRRRRPRWGCANNPLDSRR